MNHKILGGLLRNVLLIGVHDQKVGRPLLYLVNHHNYQQSLVPPSFSRIFYHFCIIHITYRELFLQAENQVANQKPMRKQFLSNYSADDIGFRGEESMGESRGRSLQLFLSLVQKSKLFIKIISIHTHYSTFRYYTHFTGKMTEAQQVLVICIRVTERTLIKIINYVKCRRRTMKRRERERD